MKEQYNQPKIEVVIFENEDIITTSGVEEGIVILGPSDNN